MTSSVAVILAAFALSGAPSFPNSGNPCKDACALTRRTCDGACKKKQSKAKSRGNAEASDQALVDELPDDPEACRQSCDEQVSGCFTSCQTALRHVEAAQGKDALQPKPK